MTATALFRYPKVRHKRAESPPIYPKYQKYKPHLIREFSNTCVYCRTPDIQPASEVFGVDHYKPKKKFPELECDYSNLYFACNKCNRLKADYYPKDASEPRVPNPCEDVMFDHLRYSGRMVSGSSNHGDWTIELLQLNHDDRVQWREALLLFARATDSELDRLNRTIARLESLLASGTAVDHEDLERLRNLAAETAEISRRFAG